MSYFHGTSPTSSTEKHIEIKDISNIEEGSPWTDSINTSPNKTQDNSNEASKADPMLTGRIVSILKNSNSIESPSDKDRDNREGDPSSISLESNRFTFEGYNILKETTDDKVDAEKDTKISYSNGCGLKTPVADSVAILTLCCDALESSNDCDCKEKQILHGDRLENLNILVFIVNNNVRSL